MLLVLPGQVWAEVRLGRTTLSFATVEEGKRVLTSRDDYVERMSAFDRAARLKTDRVVLEREYLEFVGKAVVAWEEAEKEKVYLAMEGVEEALKKMALPFPKKIWLIKTTGQEEGNAAYTRANAIVFPEKFLKGGAPWVQRVLCHELFHVLSRANRELREKCYAAIGFEKCDELEFPEELAGRKLTNPDAPRNEHCLKVKIDGEEQWVIPILFSNEEKYDPAKGGEFFRYLQFKLLVVERAEEGMGVEVVRKGGKAKLLDAGEVTGFLEQVGENTTYLIHPEEILADNFVLLVTGKRGVPSPEVVEKLGKVLAGRK
ncbi:MAG: hypothetical protein MK194_01095 [Roseibacillus sp.]|nr:hypothetical protein [Roseibacillus sp.]